jgi:hypothetical protein
LFVIVVLNSRQLRVKVYKYCFVLDEAVGVGPKRPLYEDESGSVEESDDNAHTGRGYVSLNERVKASFQFLRTSKQVYNEAIHILYGNNQFVANSMIAANQFKERIGDNPTACVRDLVFLVCYSSNRFGCSVLRSFAALKNECFVKKIKKDDSRSKSSSGVPNTTISSRDPGATFPTTLPDVAQTLLNLSQANINCVNITVAVVYEMYFRLNVPPSRPMGYIGNLKWCARQLDRYQVVTNTATHTRNSNTEARPLGSRYIQPCIPISGIAEDFKGYFGLKGYMSSLWKWKYEPSPQLDDSNDDNGNLLKSRYARLRRGEQ